MGEGLLLKCRFRFRCRWVELRVSSPNEPPGTPSRQVWELHYDYRNSKTPESNTGETLLWVRT